MATLSRGQTFGVTETVTNTKLHALVDSATITGIVDADIAAGAAIQFSKLLASSIDGSLLVNLQNVVSGAGKLPFANLNVPFGSSYVSLVSIPNTSLLPLTQASWVDGAALRNLQSLPSQAGQFSWYNLVSSLATGGIPRYQGGSTFVGSVLKNPTMASFNNSVTETLTLGTYGDPTGFSLSLAITETSDVYLSGGVTGYSLDGVNHVRWSLFRDTTILHTGVSMANGATIKAQFLGAKDAALAPGTYTYKIRIASNDGGGRTYTNSGFLTAMALPV